MDKSKASPDPTDIRRVLLPLPPSTLDAEAVRVVTRLAGRLRAEILGLFLKDETVGRGAAVPYAREVRRLPAAIVPSSPEGTERQLQAQIRWAEALLRKEARKTGIRGRLQVATDSVVDTVRSVSGAGDLIVIGEPVLRAKGMDSLLESLVGGVHPVLTIPPWHLLPPLGIAVVFAPTSNGVRALQTAGQMARRLRRTGITLLVLNDDAERDEETIEGVRRFSEAHEMHVSVRRLAALELPHLAKAVPTEGHGLLVVPRPLLQPAMRQMLHTLRTLPGPFLVTP